MWPKPYFSNNAHFIQMLCFQSNYNWTIYDVCCIFHFHALSIRIRADSIRNEEWIKASFDDMEHENPVISFAAAHFIVTYVRKLSIRLNESHKQSAWLSEAASVRNREIEHRKPVDNGTFSAKNPKLWIMFDIFDGQRNQTVVVLSLLIWLRMSMLLVTNRIWINTRFRFWFCFRSCSSIQNSWNLCLSCAVNSCR